MEKKTQDGVEGRQAMRVLWITNFAAPYRLPVWRKLADHYELEVAVLVDADNFHRDGKDRGKEWSPSGQSESTFSFGVLSAYRLPRIARPFYFLRAVREQRRFPAGGSVLLGGWEEPAYWQALVLAKLKGTRTVGFYESTMQSQTYRSGVIASARKTFFRSLDAVVVPGPAAAAAVREMGVRESKIFEGFNAVDVAAFDSARRANANPGNNGGHRYVYVGRLIELKNIPNIVAAFALIAFEGDTLTLIGTGELRAELLRQVRSLGLEDRVFFVGPVPYSDLPGVMVQYDTLVLASLTEVWGLVVNEALAAGLHCVVGNRCGVAASVQGMRGVYISGIDAEDLATRMSMSRSDWEGPISAPEMLDKTPESFAMIFADAVRRERGRGQ
ncbi:glycosyltransferase [Arthrobacter antioxidans]|uniref:glycosyltransferase n=1 Tax=Arthrobacter antioxidans TaxID=2895818 RepID=UPI001FFF6CAE|nr:glycosyltransferase [Arthrobacter antioxidans]